MPWRRVIHNFIVETLSNNPTFQRFAHKTTTHINDLGKQTGKIAESMNDQQANNETAEKIKTFAEVFVSEFQDGWRRVFGGKR